MGGKQEPPSDTVVEGDAAKGIGKRIFEKIENLKIRSHDYAEFKESPECPCDKRHCYAYKAEEIGVPMTEEWIRAIMNFSIDTGIKIWFAYGQGTQTAEEFLKNTRERANLDDATHQAVLVHYRCTDCNADFEVTYEVANTHPVPTPGRFTVITRQVRTRWIRKSYAEVRAAFDGMWKDYDWVTRNCKTFARSLFNKLIDVDPLVTRVQNFLDYATPKMFAEVEDDKKRKSLNVGIAQMSYNFQETIVPMLTPDYRRLYDALFQMIEENPELIGGDWQLSAMTVYCKLTIVVAANYEDALFHVYLSEHPGTDPKLKGMLEFLETDVGKAVNKKNLQVGLDLLKDLKDKLPKT